ncbi:hypothetical protein UNDKW_5119 [Undibacterium sp. KW1]|uniref:hypothetical protein n=1 Tax=Undibacterium sp. KW1 TaxID=2058624 RepID=UPI001331E673|nr:hypothetical protein [Undibacterium sp. KW1]BBB63392.1 hypothetical protein UNDKW_5119 [Undibacterium sp. KW1]
MKSLHSLKTLSLLSVSLACIAAPALAADYNPFPKAGVYDASDNGFERLLTVKPDGKFTLEVAEKGKPGNLRSGAGEGKLTDAPGGWSFSEGRCNMTLKRAAGGMQLHVETCASAWGDVPFDGKYKYQGEEVAAAPVKAGPVPAPMQKAAAPAPATTTAAPAAAVTAVPAPTPASGPLPSRKELMEKWANIATDGIAGKSVLVWTKSTGSISPDTTLEAYSQAAFVVDTTSDYQALSATEKAKSPLRLINIPLPATGPKEGLEFEVDCKFGKSDKVIAINVASQAKGKPVTRKRTSAWMLNNNFEVVEVKPANKAKCPTAQAGY